MTVFSVTDRGTFRRCRRKWDYSSNTRQNLTPLGSGPEPLELGGLIHRALADWILIYTDNPKEALAPGILRERFLINAAKRQEEITTSFQEKVGHNEIPEMYLASLHDVVQLGADMMQNYQEFHKTPLPKHMRFALPEQEIQIPVPGTDHICPTCSKSNYGITTLGPYAMTDPNCVECNGKGVVPHYLRMTLDGLAQDTKDLLYVLEHKTYENRPKPMDLYMNDQFTGYAWGSRELKIGKVAGLAYDGMWKRNKPPKYMQKERRAGILSDLFIRKTIPKEDAELDEWGVQLAKELNEMGNNPAIYPNVPWQGCSDCSFQEVCYMQLRGEDNSSKLEREYTQRPIVRSSVVI